MTSDPHRIDRQMAFLSEADALKGVNRHNVLMDLSRPETVAEHRWHVALWALVLARRMKIGAVASMVAPYPTLSEVSKRVAGAYYAPRLFENARLKRIVGLIQRWLP